MAEAGGLHGIVFDRPHVVHKIPNLAKKMRAFHEMLGSNPPAADAVEG